VSQYYLRKDGKTFGPCSQQDVLTYLAYGSIDLSDEARRWDETAFAQVGHLPEFANALPRKRRRPGNTSATGPVRYRDYLAVPPQRRSGAILGSALLGFFLFPPRLWRSAYNVWRHEIWGHRRDPQGFLKPWPHFMRWVLLAMVLLQGLLGLALLGWLTEHGDRVLQTLLHWIYQGA
jgi:hypothetical protein